MGRRSRRGVMSEAFKYELAKELGFYDTVQREGWSGIRTKDAGNMVKRAIEIAEQALAQQQGAASRAVAPQTGSSFGGPSASASYAGVQPGTAYGQPSAGAPGGGAPQTSVSLGQPYGASYTGAAAAPYAAARPASMATGAVPSPAYGQTGGAYPAAPPFLAAGYGQPPSAGQALSADY